MNGCRQMADCGEREREMAGEPLKYHAKIRVYRIERNFGPGTVELMSLVRQTGSLSSACKQMGMAYSKAWKMVGQAEADLGFSLMEGVRGGEHGGSTVLTERGEDLLNRYLAFERDAKVELDRLFERHFGGMQSE